MTRLLASRSELARKYRLVLFAIASIAFAVGSLVAWQRLPTDLGAFEWWPIVLVALIGVPLTIALNAAEYREIARVADLDVEVFSALRIAVLGTAANMAPLPGALLVRWGDMARRGSRWGISVNANLLAGTVWLTLSATALTLLTVSDRGLVFWVALGIAIAGASASLVLIRVSALGGKGLLALAIIEGGILFATSLRAYLILAAFGMPGGFPTALAIASTYALSGFIGIFPAGLGIREILSGIVAAPAAGGLSSGFVVSAVDRIVGLAIHAPLAVWLSSGSNGTRRTSPVSAEG